MIRSSLQQLSQRSDLALMALLLLIIFMIIVPLPTWLIDLFITINIGIVLLTLALIITLSNPASFSTFPSVLLFATLLRLAISISTTRMILVQADAGQIVEAFGNFVVGGNMVVGMVIFLIITVVQFIVITKGAERVAEVSARFALDALPGKQMAIDADMRAGEIDLKEARKRRAQVRLESDFYGSMDGAMKFVKGDSIAGIVIILVNLVGGIAVGVGQNGMSFGQASTVYSLLTVGDGLVSQIPALITAVAAGIVITRISREAEDGQQPDLGGEILSQLRGSGAPLNIAAGALLIFALIPGFPTLAFVGLAIMFFSINLLIQRNLSRSKTDELDGGLDDNIELTPFSPIILEVGDSVRDQVDVADFQQRLTDLQEELYATFGVPFPRATVRLIGEPDSEEEFRISVGGVPIRGSRIPLKHVRVLEEPTTLQSAEIPFETTREDDQEIRWVNFENLQQLTDLGLHYQSLELYFIEILKETFPHNVEEFLGVEETSSLLDSMQGRYGTLVDAAKKAVETPSIAQVLRNLLSERVALINFRVILEALIQWGPKEEDPNELTNHVRMALARQISYQYANRDGRIACYLFEPALENQLREAVRYNQMGSFLALDPDVTTGVVEAVKQQVQKPSPSEETPVLIVSEDLRRTLKNFLLLHNLDIPVLAQKEVSAKFQIYPLGIVSTVFDAVPGV